MSVLTPELFQKLCNDMLTRKREPETIAVPPSTYQALQWMSAYPEDYEIAEGIAAFLIWACTDRGWPTVWVSYNPGGDLYWDDDRPVGFRNYEICYPSLERYVDREEYERRRAIRTSADGSEELEALPDSEG